MAGSQEGVRGGCREITYVTEVVGNRVLLKSVNDRKRSLQIAVGMGVAGGCASSRTVTDVPFELYFLAESHSTLSSL
jgi:hypothetical protein